jgi:uncharacterized protein (DUF2249 family)
MAQVVLYLLNCNYAFTQIIIEKFMFLLKAIYKQDLIISSFLKFKYGHEPSVTVYHHSVPVLSMSDLLARQFKWKWRDVIKTILNLCTKVSEDSGLLG